MFEFYVRDRRKVIGSDGEGLNINCFCIVMCNMMYCYL